MGAGESVLKDIKRWMYLAMVAEWVYEWLQIQVGESHRSQVQIQLGTCNYNVEIVTKKQLYPALTYSNKIS